MLTYPAYKTEAIDEGTVKVVTSENAWAIQHDFENPLYQKELEKVFDQYNDAK